MRFDDRLKTVLAQPARSAHDRAVRWRQLIELLARASGPATALVERARGEVRAERDHIDEQLRAATARAIARAQLPEDLVAFFAAATITVAAPVLAAAVLEPGQWEKVLEGASAEARRFILALHSDLQPAEPARPAVPVQDAAPAEEKAEPEPEAAPPQGAIPSISDVVARIERLRRARQPAPADSEDRRRRAAMPVAGGAALFRWECGPSGEIAWVEGAPRGALIGRSLASPGEHNGVDDRIQRAFALRAPFRDAHLSVSGEGVAAGEWKISGVPAFEPVDGRFAGYRGVATRAGEAPGAQPARPVLDDDAVRELVHELKTPLNAIIGFAEIIDGQYLGPADHVYRERAAHIVAQARLLLAAIEDLDTAAQLRSAAAGAPGASDLAELVTAISPDLRDQAARRGAAIDLDLGKGAVRCALERGLAERIVRRFCNGAIDGATAGERLSLTLNKDCSLSIDRPVALRGPTLDELLAPGAEERETADLGSAFSLRLARALAQVAGGDVTATDKKLTLKLPPGR